jgi:hypothetical protein
MTNDRKLIPAWAEDALLDSLAGEGSTMWTEEKMQALYEWAQRAILWRRTLDRVRDCELWIEDIQDGEPVVSERDPYPVRLLRLVPK